MSKYKFGVCEFSFPCWGPLALQMAHEAGFTGMQLADAGGSTNSYPLNNKRVQDSYLDASAKYGIELQSIHLFTLVRQNFIRFSQSSPEGQECMESIKKGIIAASEMRIPTVMIEGMRMYGAAQYKHVFQMYQYAVKTAEDYGVQIAMETDIRLEDHFQFLDRFNGKLKLCFDAHNPVMYGTGYPPDMIRTLGRERFDHFHIKESQANEDGYLSVETPIVLMGQGCTYFRESAQAVKEIGFEGWIVSENFYFRPNILEQGLDCVSAARRDVESLHAVYGTE